jgi:predicted ABC-type ATPase
MSAKKQLWILTGGNGTGKSTFYRLFLEPLGIKLINADIIAKEINPEQQEMAAYQAATLAEKLREDLISQGTSFCFETVFSHPSKIDFIARAKSLGYEIILVFIHLDSIELNVARVSQRVSEGGHSVPTHKIISRIPRILKNITKTLLLADEARLLDNSFADDPYRQVAVIKQGTCKTLMNPLPPWAKIILKSYI